MQPKARNRTTSALLALFLAISIVGASCGDSDDSNAEEDAPVATDTASSEEGDASTSTGIRLVSPEEGETIRSDPPEGLVILDVRTPEEFAEGHIEDAIMIDFYEDDFADRLAELDPDTPYLLYCRSGNRSAQTATLLADLEFSDVAEIDGGIAAWTAAGLPVVVA